MPEAKRPFRNMVHDLASKWLEASKQSPIMAHAAAQAPHILGMLLETVIQPNIDIRWESAGLRANNSHRFNIHSYAYRQTNEIADATANVLGGYADLVRGIGDILPDVGAMYSQREMTEREVLKLAAKLKK